MAFDVTSAKTRVGLATADLTKDPLLTAALNAAIAIAENYCDRFFFYKHEKVVFYHNSAPRLQLKRYPIEKVDSITEGLTTGPNAVPVSVFDSSKYHVHKAHGYLEQHSRHVRWHDIIEIEYSGGYKVLPADLEIALWGIFDNVWASMSATSGGAAATNTNAISSISIPDVGTISFAQGGTANVSANGVRNPIYSAYGPYFGLLDTYRDHSC